MNSVELAMHATKSRKGFVSDKVIMLDNLEKYKKLTLKTANGRILDDDGPFRANFHDHWCILASKGYQGMGKNCCMIIPKKKPRNDNLTLAEKLKNSNIFLDRIIVENFLVDSAAFGV